MASGAAVGSCAGQFECGLTVIRQLRYFAEVADRGSFSEAAQSLGVTQSALSRQISLLEQALSQRLFHRNGRGVVINGAGETFLVHARAVLARLDEARREMAPSLGAAQGEAGMHPSVRRGFADTPGGQVHYREAGEGRPLVMLHASPGSSKQLEMVMPVLAAHRKVIAPDTPGNGDSPPLPGDAPTIYTLAAALLSFLDAMGLEQVDLYGSHTGADIAAEVAISAPHRVRRLVQDGAGILSKEQSAEFLEHYAHPFPPDLEGAYLQRAFTFCRDQFFFFPWYARDRAHRRDGGFTTPEKLHEWVLEVLKACTTYHHNYRATFAYPSAERLKLVTVPTLAIATENDPLRPATEAIVPEMQDAVFRGLPPSDMPGYLPAFVSTIDEFLSQERRPAAAATAAPARK